MEHRSTRLRAEWWIIFVISFLVVALAIYHFGVWPALISYFGVVASAAKTILGAFLFIIAGGISAGFAYLGNIVDIAINMFS